MDNVELAAPAPQEIGPGGPPAANPAASQGTSGPTSGPGAAQPGPASGPAIDGAPFMVHSVPGSIGPPFQQHQIASQMSYMHPSQLQFPPNPPPIIIPHASAIAVPQGGVDGALMVADNADKRLKKRRRGRELKAPDTSRYRNRKDFRPGQGTRKRLEKAAHQVIEEFKKATAEHPQLEAPLLRAMLADPRMRTAVETLKVTLPTKGPAEFRKPKIERILQITNGAKSEREADTLIVKHRYESGEMKKATVLQLKSYLKTYRQSQLGNKQQLLERAIAHLSGNAHHQEMHDEVLMENADELLDEVDDGRRDYEEEEDMDHQEEGGGGSGGGDMVGESENDGVEVEEMRAAEEGPVGEVQAQNAQAPQQQSMQQLLVNG